MKVNQDKNSPDNDFYLDIAKFDIFFLLISLKRKIPLIIISSVVFFIIFGIGAKLLIGQKWKATVIMVGHDKNISKKSDIPYLYQELGVDTVMEIIKIRKNLETVIEKLKLNMTPDKLMGMIKVEQGNSDMISLSVIDNDRKEVVEIANCMARVFIESYIEIQNSSVRQVYEYYKNRESSLRKEIAVQENDFDSFLKKHNIVSIETEKQFKLQQRNEFEIKLLNSKMQVSDLKTKIHDLGEKIKTMQEDVKLQYIVSATDTKALDAMQEELALLRQRYTDKNPKIIKLKSDIEFLKKKIAEGDKRQAPQQITYGENTLKKSLEMEKLRSETQLKATTTNIKAYQELIRGLEKGLEKLNSLDNEYLEMKSATDMKRRQLLLASARVDECKNALESTRSDLEIIEKAYPPKYPLQAHRKIIALAGAFLGFVFALLFFVGREFFDFSVKSKYDFDKFLGIRVGGMIPDRNESGDSVFFSAMHMLVDKVRQFHKSNEKSVITVTSATPETGKSFIIENVIAMLNSKPKILFIDTVKEVRDDIKDFVINEFLYPKEEEKHHSSPKFNKISENQHKLYFHLNSHTYKYVLEDEAVSSFLKTVNGYDYIFWKLPDVNRNPQICATIASRSNLTVFVTKFRLCNKFDVRDDINFLRESGMKNIIGVLNYIDKNYYEKIV